MSLAKKIEERKKQARLQAKMQELEKLKALENLVETKLSDKDEPTKAAITTESPLTNQHETGSSRSAQNKVSDVPQIKPVSKYKLNHQLRSALKQKNADVNTNRSVEVANNLNTRQGTDLNKLFDKQNREYSMTSQKREFSQKAVPKESLKQKNDTFKQEETVNANSLHKKDNSKALNYSQQHASAQPPPVNTQNKQHGSEIKQKEKERLEKQIEKQLENLTQLGDDEASELRRSKIETEIEKNIEKLKEIETEEVLEERIQNDNKLQSEGSNKLARTFTKSSYSQIKSSLDESIQHKPNGKQKLTKTNKIAVLSQNDFIESAPDTKQHMNAPKLTQEKVIALNKHNTEVSTNKITPIKNESIDLKAKFKQNNDAIPKQNQEKQIPVNKSNAEAYIPSSNKVGLSKNESKNQTPLQAQEKTSNNEAFITSTQITVSPAKNDSTSLGKQNKIVPKNMDANVVDLQKKQLESNIFRKLEELKRLENENENISNEIQRPSQDGDKGKNCHDDHELARQDSDYEVDSEYEEVDYITDERQLESYKKLIRRRYW